MRPREREQDPPPPESTSPTAVAPPTRPAGSLSSMVVRPADSGDGGVGAGGDFDKGDVRNRRDSPVRRRMSSSLDLRRRRESPPRREPPIGFHRRGSPPDLYRRGGAGGSPAALRPRSQRFSDNPVSKFPGLGGRSL